jgi:4-amino-4-deoxy-L-arabinose transferase-like glycosyltransferase
MTNLLRFLVISGFLITFVCAISACVELSQGTPHGSWDAWAIWNVRARFMYRGDFAASFAPGSYIPHQDYPLLIPTLVASGWWLVGQETQLVPILVAAAFTFGTVALLVAVIRSYTDWYLALASGAILLATNNFIRFGIGQVADIPLSFFILATLVSLYQAAQGKSRRWVIVAGITTGLATWTKNEGILFAGVCLVCIVIIRLFQQRKGRTDKLSLIAFVATLGPFLLLAVIYKALVPANDIVAGQGTSTLARVLDPSRYLVITRYFITNGIRLGQGSIVLLVLITLAVGLKKGQTDVIRLLGLILALMVLGYGFIYLITPLDLVSHIGTSMPRLLLHLWPSVLLVFFLAVDLPTLRKPSAIS